MRHSVAFLVASFLFMACANTSHPEYHPQTSYSYVQNVTYAENAYSTAPATGAAAATDPTEPTTGELETLSKLAGHERGACIAGHAAECWRDCFMQSKGPGCRLLGWMFLTGNGVSRDLGNAHRLYTMACNLGDCGPQGPAPTRTTSGDVSSPGSVIVYGNFNGNVYVGR